MGIIAHRLASGPGWTVNDVVCSAGPHDPAFEERHDTICFAAVTEGTFQYRSARGSAVLAPGSVLLGDVGDHFECGHDHGTGDRCLSFHLSPGFLDAILADVPGARQSRFALPSLPPLRPLMPLLAMAEAARDLDDRAELEELTLRLGGAIAATLADGGRKTRRPTPRDERRITDSLRRIELESEEPLALGDLAREAGMSPFHFLRVFRALVGMTPHQYVLRTRLHRAALRLLRSDAPVSAIAFDAGFGDLSTFNRRFRQIMGASPGLYRARSGVRGPGGR